jgi:hypothetical protein
VRERFGAQTWELAQSLWTKLQEKEEVEEAARDVVVMSDDPDARAALRLQLKKLLAQDKKLAADLAQILEEFQTSRPSATYHAEVHGSGAIAQGPSAVAAGERSVAVGGSVGGSVIVTGDANIIGDASEVEVKD